MPLQIHQFPCRSDNYGFLAHEPDSELTACIDTPDADAINATLEEKGWRLTHILNTHHHEDHIGANLLLKEHWACTIVGAANDAERIPGIDVRVSEGDEYTFGSIAAKVFEVPGHVRTYCVLLRDRRCRVRWRYFVCAWMRSPIRRDPSDDVEQLAEADGSAR